MMYDLFNPMPEPSTKDGFNSEIDLKKINGLIYVREFLTEEEESNVMQIINAQPWITDLKRRVQHYGWRYDYRARSINRSMHLGQLPTWADRIAKRLYDNNYTDKHPDQLIVNEYEPGQGIAPHIDCEPCFGEFIVSISLGSICVMDFCNSLTKEKVEILLEPRSAVILGKEARHKWTHGISQRKIDTFKSHTFPRKRRVSLTFRDVIF